MKYKQFLSIGVAIIIVSLVVAPAMAQKIKVGYLNSQKVLSSYQEVIDVQKKIENLKNQWETELINMQRELQQMLEEFESQNLLLSETRKVEKQQEMQALDTKIKEFYQEKLAPGQGELFQRQEEFMKPIQEKISAAIEKLGDEGKYDIIFDEVVGNILYAAKEIKIDLSNRLLEELNKGTAPKK